MLMGIVDGDCRVEIYIAKNATLGHWQELNPAISVQRSNQLSYRGQLLSSIYVSIDFLFLIYYPFWRENYWAREKSLFVLLIVA